MPEKGCTPLTNQLSEKSVQEQAIINVT